MTRQDTRRKQGLSSTVSQVSPPPGNSPSVPKKEELVCSGCKEKGHVRKNCPYYDTRCMKCGQTGHANRHCSYVHGNLPYASGHTDSDFSGDASVNMVLMQETDVPENPRPLTSDGTWKLG